MNSELPTSDAARRAPVRRQRRLLGLAVVALLGFTACESQPSSRRIAQDIINTLAEEGSVRDCMLDKLDGYTDEQLDEITASASQPGPGTAIELFEADLESCR